MNIVQKEQQVKNTELEIARNVLWSDDYFIQLSNVSQVQALPVQYSYKYALILLGIGLFLSVFQIWALGIPLLLIGAAVAYFTYSSRANPKYGVFVTLDSGHTLRFECNNREFAYRVVKRMRERVDNPSGSTVINFQGHGSIQNFVGNSIKDSTVVTGNDNQIEGKKANGDK